MFRRIAIIGGGAAAATLVGQLVERAQGNELHLDWYAGSDSPGRGVAYGTPSQRHLLNVRAASMGMFTGKPQGFVDYARQRLPNVSGTDFLPRCLYGDYLQNEVARTLELARERGIDLQLLPLQADALVPENRGVTVLQGQDSRRADAAVLAIGSLPPQPLAGVDAAALASGRYVVEPWQFLRQSDHLPPPREVVLIGLGLTAVDVLLELAERWPQAHFTALSRHGHLPEAHLPHASAPGDDGGALVEAMQESPAIRSWLALIRDAVGQSNDWRTVIDSLRPHTPSLWQGLPPEERQRFMRHARWAWERVRHRMPPQVAQTIHALEVGGRLQRRRGRVRSITLAGDQLQLHLRGPQGAEPVPYHADLVIQTVGLNTDVRQGHVRLLEQLRAKGQVVADPLGLGLRVEPDGRVQHQGGSWPQLFAIGSLLRGSLWESTAMPEIRQQARSLAERLLAP